MSVPTGTIVAFYGDTAPKGWLPCDGMKIPDSEGALRSICGQKTPDLRGLFIRGYDQGQPGKTPDPDRATRVLGDVQVQQIQTHFHYTKGRYTGVAEGGGSALGHPGLPFDPNAPENGAGVNRTEDYPYGQSSAETRPNNMCLLYIIKT